MIFESAQDGKQFELHSKTHTTIASSSIREETRKREAIILRVVLVVDSLQLTDVQVPHSLQPLQLRLDLRLLLHDTQNPTQNICD